MKRSGYPKLQQRQLQSLGGEQFAHARARAADNRVFLDRHDGTVARRKRSHEVLIERLDEAHVDERGIQLLGNLLRGIHERAKCQYRKAAASLRGAAVRVRAAGPSSATIGTPGPVPRG
jgi:hypothetical protein